jgi:hypothetical protein
MLFGLVGGIALGLVVGRTTKHEIAFVVSAGSASPGAAEWIRSKPAAARTSPEAGAPEPAIDYISSLSQLNDVLALSAGTPDSPVRRK